MDEVTTDRPHGITGPPPPPMPDVPAPGSKLWLRRVATSLIALAALVFVVWMVPFRDRCTPDGCRWQLSAAAIS